MMAHAKAGAVGFEHGILDQPQMIEQGGQAAAELLHASPMNAPDLPVQSIDFSNLYDPSQLNQMLSPEQIAGLAGDQLLTSAK